jgi:hypothetical protein
MSKQNWETAFDDWQKLLSDAKATELLSDPKAVWDEAWRQVAMVAINVAEQNEADAVATELFKRFMR